MTLKKELERIKELAYKHIEEVPNVDPEEPKAKCKYGCDGSGVIILSNDRACQCQCVVDKHIQAKTNKLLKFADVPGRFKDADIKNYDINMYDVAENKVRAKEVKTIANNFVKNYELLVQEGVGLYLYSQTPGSGKSTMAVAIANELMKTREITVKYTTVSELLNEIRATYSNMSDITQNELIEAVMEVDLLILDELGVEKVTDWVEETFFSIINNRVSNSKLTLYTSNLQISELTYAARVKSRIASTTQRVLFPEEDVRIKLGKNRKNTIENLLKGE